MHFVKGYFSLLLLIESYRIPFISQRSQSFNYWSLYVTLLIVARSRHMQYIFYLNIVNRQLHLLLQELQRIEEFSKYNRTKLSSPSKYSYNKFLCRRLFLAREYYSLIFEISVNINDTFGWSHLVNLTHSFVQILTDSYWLYYWNNDNQTDVLFGGKKFGNGNFK